MRYPDGFESQHIGENIVWQRPAQIGQEGGVFMRRCLQGLCSPSYPRIVRVDSCGFENFISGGGNFHVVKTVTVQMSAQSRQYLIAVNRSEERRVGKECRSRWCREHLKNMQ